MVERTWSGMVVDLVGTIEFKDCSSDYKISHGSRLFGTTLFVDLRRYFHFLNARADRLNPLKLYNFKARFTATDHSLLQTDFS